MEANVILKVIVLFTIELNGMMRLRHIDFWGSKIHIPIRQLIILIEVYPIETRLKYIINHVL